jgi:hypothetical protein
LGRLDIKGADGLDDQGGEQTGAIGLEESVQGSPQGVIAQVLGGAQSWVVGLGPSFDA